MRTKVEVVPDEFVQKYMRRGRNSPLTPARLQAALALLERIRTNPSTILEDHLASKGSSGLQFHEKYGDLAHERLELQRLNKNHGRRSSSLQDWGQLLLDMVNAAGFSKASKNKRVEIIGSAQKPFAEAIRKLIEQDPLQVRIRGRSVAAIIADILVQAEDKGKAGDVAQYIVGAKLMLRLNITLPAHKANKGDRASRTDETARLGDFEIGDAVIEVALGPPDEKHIQQIETILDDPNLEVWLLTKSERVNSWLTELALLEPTALRRVTVDSVEGFVGQNIAELSQFKTKERTQRLEELFELYNDHWIKSVGFPGIRITIAK